MFLNIISIYFFVMVITVIYCAAHIRSLNGSSYAKAVVLLCLSVCFYIFGYSMELNSDSVSQILFWNTIEYLGIPFVSALWFSVALMYTGHYFQHKKLFIAAIYIIPFVSMILRFTNNYHHLYLSSEKFAFKYGKLLLVKTPGPWTYVQLFHSMLMIFITLGLLIHDFIIKNKEKETRKIKLMIAASFFAVAGLILSILKPFGFQIDYMALCLPVTCIMVIISILRYDFLETKSMARSKVFEASRDAILLINQQKKIIDYNKSAKQLFEKMNINISVGYTASLFKRTPDLLESLDNTEASIIKLNIDTKEKYYEINTKGIDNHSASLGWIKTIRDVTETYTLNQSLKQQAMMDELSGLSNRRAFMQMGQELMMKSDENGETIHLLMLDLDHFKKVNDQYGHQMGDKVIQDFGEIMKKSFRTNSLIARLGGEEFGVLLSGYSDTEIKEKANTLLRSIELHEHSHQDKRFHVTVSIGVAKKSCPSQTLDNLMSIADKALYKSKARGRNCVTM